MCFPAIFKEFMELVNDPIDSRVNINELLVFCYGLIKL